MLLESVRIALRGLAANKLRAALTMLGITIGVAAVITLLAVGEGVSRFITAQFEGLGTNLLFVFQGQFRPGAGGLRQSVTPLTEGDAAALQAGLPEGVDVVPLLRRTVTVTAGNRDTSTTLRAVTPAYETARNFHAVSGRFISDGDLDERARVVLLGQTVREDLFPEDLDPVGQNVRINGVPFRVIGVLAEKGGTAFGEEDATVLVPFTTAASRLHAARTTRGEIQVSVIMIHFESGLDANALIFDAKNILRDRHRIAYQGEDDFTLLSEQDLIDAFGQVTGVITIFLGAIAGISLLVGGIGIMNIMLVTVTERTREIGLRKAVGATRGNILAQFLVESVVLSIVGGLAGVGLGVGGAYAIHRFVPQLDTGVTLGNVLLATGFAAAVGLFFGIYPATRAAGLRPIEALRYE